MADDFRQLLVTTLAQMRSFALMKTRDGGAAEDLLQQTALKALRAEHQFTVGTNFKAWLYRIMKNEFINSMRRKKQTINIDDLPEELFGQCGGQDDKSLKGEVFKAMDTIPPVQRNVMMMVCASGMSYAEAGVALGCSVGTVKSRLWRARHAMQAFVLDERGAAGQTLSAIPV